MAVALRNTQHEPVAPPLHVARRRWVPAVTIAIVAGALYAVHLSAPAFFDNEGRYAEVARQMVATGDWITLRLNDTLFLNKPPLTFWLAALSFETVGPGETARLASIAAAMVAIVSTVRLGALLHGEPIGTLAGLLLATTLGFVLEARTLRPDMLVVATVATALLCFAHAEAADARCGRRWLVAMYVALGVGMLAKGFVPAALAGLVITALTWQRHGIAGLPRLVSVPAIAAFAAVALPWHVAVAIRHPGFAWDYVVNQHLLFFLAKKLPRDSVGDPLLAFWATFLLRGMPWILLVPLASTASRFAWTWLATVALFFSAAPGRLEHYCLPALPAVALLAACGIEGLWTARAGRAAWRWLGAVAVLVIAGGMALLVRADRLIESAYWLRDSPLAALLRPTGGGLAGLGIVLAAAAWRRHGAAFVTALGAGSVAMLLVVVRALVLAEPLFSWKPVARAIEERLPEGIEVAFEAKEEYQLVGGLAYYLGRHVTLLELPGFVPPTYLAPHVRAMFVPRERFLDHWHAGKPVAVVSDPERRRDTADGIVPAPYHVVARFGDRWLLSNVAPWTCAERPPAAR